MSTWTYVNGTINVRIPFYASSIELVKQYIEWSVKQVQHYGCDISGSECSANFYVNAGGHASMYSSDASNSWDHGIITIDGALRDRCEDETYQDTQRFLKRLQHFVEFVSANLNVCDKRVVNIAYANLYEISIGDDDTNTICERKRDQLFRIQLKNKIRFFDSKVTLEECAKFADYLQHCSPDMVTCMLTHFGLDRVIDWDFTEERTKYMKKRGIEVNSYNAKVNSLKFHKLKYPKYSDLHVRKEYEDLVYGSHADELDVHSRAKYKRIINAFDVLEREGKLVVYV